MEANESKSNKRNFVPIIWFQAQVDVLVQNKVTGELNRIVGYEVISYIDMDHAAALYYFEDGEFWCEDLVWETYVEIEIEEDDDFDEEDYF